MIWRQLNSLYTLTSIRAKQTGYGDIKTESGSDFEYTRKDKQYYLSSTEYTLSATSSAGVNACLPGLSLELFPFNPFKIWDIIIFVLLQYCDVEKEGKISRNTTTFLIS